MAMLTLEEIESILTTHKKELRERFGVREIGVFGSYVRGEAKEDSDVDILVDFEEIPSLLKFIELEEYLEALLGLRVDLVMKSSLRPGIAKTVLREVVYV